MSDRAPTGLDLRRIIGLEMTLKEYEAEVLGGHAYYDDAPLQFECTNCGACCTRAGVVILTPADIEAIASHFEVPVSEAVATWFGDAEEPLITVDEENGCPFHENDRCAIHEVKPVQCATYPFWPEIVGTAEAWWLEAAECEGIGRGSDYPATRVRELLLGVMARTDETGALVAADNDPYNPTRDELAEEKGAPRVGPGRD